jgi:regulatory protein
MSELRQRALRLLARREHARSELRQKLAPHAESEEALDALLDDLAARHLLSDVRYAEMRINSRGSRFGNARLAQELKFRGVADELVDEALAGAGDELPRAYAIWQRKFGTLPADAAERARQTRHLLYRGFSSDVIRRILRGEGNEQEEE